MGSAPTVVFGRPMSPTTGAADVTLGLTRDPALAAAIGDISQRT
jgi:hypothetical protein